jgi:hypothetical protein
MGKEQIGATQREAQRIASGTMLYSGVVIVAFVVFVFLARPHARSLRMGDRSAGTCSTS